MWIAAVLLGFIIPVIYVVYRETRGNRKTPGGAEPAVRRRKEPFSAKAFARVAPVLLSLAVPVYFLSESPAYTFYAPNEAALKVAFKQNGRRIADCNDSDIFRKEGERYRQMLKDKKQVKMNIGKLSGCPRERHPVAVAVEMDGRPVLDKSYAPTGLRKDMSSYIYEEFLIEPGRHSFTARLSLSGADAEPDYTLSGQADVAPGGIALIRFDEQTERLVLE